MALNHFHFNFCQMAPRPPFPLFSQIPNKPKGLKVAKEDQKADRHDGH